MKNDLDISLQHRFIPYLQLHEFEGLLFNNIAVFDNQLSAEEFNRKVLKQTIDDYPNPEMINDNPETTPSARLQNLIVGYNKVVYGNIFAEAIGLTKMRAKTIRFNLWIEQLEQI